MPQSALRAGGIAAVIAAAMLWGTTGTLQAMLPDAKEPLVVAAMRLIIGGFALLALAALSRADRAAFGALPLGGIVFAGVAIGVYNLMFFLAVLSAGVGVGTAIAIGSAPVWVTLYEVVVRRRRPTRAMLTGQAVSIAGACLLVWSGSATEGAAWGIALAAMAGAAYAAYSVATSRIGHLAPPTAIAAATFSVAALVVSPVLLVVPVAWVADIRAWPVLLFLGVVSTGLSYAFYTWGLTRVAVTTAVTLALAEPLTAWLLATFVVGEPLSVTKVLGACMVLAGLAIVSVVPARRRAG